MRELPAPEIETEATPEGAYFCAYCGTAITSEGQREEQGGSFEHTFANPAGVVFRIGCFRDAPGCVAAGRHTMAHTWFTGYRWCYALCSGCTGHLGWHYRKGRGGGFYGLILDRLIAAP